MSTEARKPISCAEGSNVSGRMAHGEEIAAHSHDYGQLRYAVTGALVTATEGGSWVSTTHRINWVPPFCVHSSHSYGKTDVRVFTVPTALAARLPSEPSVFVASALTREAVLAMIDSDEPAESARIRLLLEVVVTELTRAPKDALRLPEPKDARLKAVTDLLHADPGTPETLAELGHRTGASERTLSRLFSSELSMGFQQWRTLLRVQRALFELCEGATVTDTALHLGWENPSSFIDAFSELVGQTPGRYRSAVLAGSP